MRVKCKLATQHKKRANQRIATQTRQLQKLHGINAVIDVTDNESQPVCVLTLTLTLTLTLLLSWSAVILLLSCFLSV